MTDFKMVALADITPDPNQPRKFYDETAMDELINSVREKDVLQPILLRPIGCSAAYLEKDPAAPVNIETRRAIGYKGPAYLLVCGERRYRAATAVMAAFASRNTIPAVIRELTDEEALELQIIENLQRKDVHPIEEAVAFQSLLEKGKDITEIANRVGKSVYYARQRVKLCNLTKEWQQAFFSGRLENTNDALLIAAFDHKVQKELYKEEEHYNGKIRLNDWHLRKYRGDLSKAPFSLDDTTLDKKAGPCTNCKFNSAAANLFPDAAANPKCTNVSCFQHKCDVHFDHALDEAIKDPLIIFVNTDYSDLPSNNKVLARLVKEGHQVLNGRMRDGVRVVEPPEYPDKEEYQDDDYSAEENEADFAKAVAGYQQDLAEYEKKVSSGKYKKAFSIHGDDKGHYVFLEIGKSSGSSDSKGSSTLTKQKEAAGKLTLQDITDEIKRIQDREKRAKELDAEKVHARIVAAVKDDKSIKSVPAATSPIDAVLARFLLQELIDYNNRDLIKKHTGLAGVWGHDDPVKLHKQLEELTDEKVAFLVRQLMIAKHDTNFPNGKGGYMFRKMAESLGTIPIAAYEQEQQEVATKRQDRVNKRIAELQAKKKELTKPAAKKEKSPSPKSKNKK